MIADGGRGDADFASQDAALAIGLRQQFLRDDRLQAVGQLHDDRVLLLGRKDAVDPLDGLHGVGRVQRGQDEVPGLGGGQRRFDRFQVAHFADYDDVGVLAEDVDQGLAEGATSVCTSCWTTMLRRFSWTNSTGSSMVTILARRLRLIIRSCS